MRTGFAERGGWWVVAQVVAFTVVAVVYLQDPRTLVSPVPAVAGLAVVAAGAVLAGDGVWRLRATITPYPAPLEGARLVDAGSYGLVRHPIYGGGVLMVVGMSAAVGSWPTGAAGVGLGVFFLVKSSWEERLLAEAVPGYERYCSKVRKRLIPFVI
jgi:protein-S-isoprenylcysteine O-methyltransferase Ste14